MDEERDIVLENFAVYLKLMGYRNHRMPGENNSLFHAIAAVSSKLEGRYVRELTPEQMNERQMEARRQVHAFILENLDDYMDLVEVGNDDATTSAEIRQIKLQKIDLILENGHFGGKESLNAFAKLSRRRIVVERPLQDPDFVLPDQIDGTIYLSKIRESHYNFLELRKNKQEDEDDHLIVSLYFREYLRLRNFELIPISRGIHNPFNALAAAFERSPDNAHVVREKLRVYNRKEYQEIILEKLSPALLDGLDVDGVNLAIDGYMRDVFEMKIKCDDLLIHLATLAYKTSIIVLQPLKPQKQYLFQDQGPNDAVHLARPTPLHYDYISPITNNTENRQKLVEDVDVIFVDPSIPVDNNDSSELLYIQNNVFKNLRSPVFVVFLVPMANLKHPTLMDVLQREKPKFLKLAVLYNVMDFRQMKGDKEIIQNFTMYSRKYEWPGRANLRSRINRLALFLLPPAFLTVAHITWQNIPVEVMFKCSKNSLPINLLTKSWLAVREIVKADVDKVIASSKDIICMDCNSDCELKDVLSHYNARKFRKIIHENISCVDSCKKFDILTSNQDTLPNVVKKVQEIHRSNTCMNPIIDLFDYLDSSVEVDSKWRTYLVLHVDGPRIESYQGRTSYFDMINDGTNKKCIYAGVTTNSVFRYSHFVTSSSLSQVFTRTSRLYMLRSKKFPEPSLAKRDEAIMIEIITTWLQSKSDKQEQPNFLFLNLQAQCMELLGDAGTSNPKIWAQFAASDIPMFQTDPNDTREFDHPVFKGNFKNPKRLDIVEGTLPDRSYQQMENVYCVIEARQP